MSQDQPTFSHSGQRYLLGYTSAEYALWDRQTPGPPIRRFPKNDAGWNEAWAAYQQLEAPPSPTPAPEPTPAAAPAARPAAEPSPATAAPAAGPAAPTTPLPSSPPAGGGPAVPQMTGKVLAQVLTITGWALLVLFPLFAIASFTVGGSGFYTIAQGLAYLAFGPALWAICLTLAKVAQRSG